MSTNIWTERRTNLHQSFATIAIDCRPRSFVRCPASIWIRSRFPRGSSHWQRILHFHRVLQWLHQQQRDVGWMRSRSSCWGFSNVPKWLPSQLAWMVQTLKSYFWIQKSVKLTTCASLHQHGTQQHRDSTVGSRRWQFLFAPIHVLDLNLAVQVVHNCGSELGSTNPWSHILDWNVLLSRELQSSRE